jgi:hypothetical protein
MGELADTALDWALEVKFLSIPGCFATVAILSVPVITISRAGGFVWRVAAGMWNIESGLLRYTVIGLTLFVALFVDAALPAF